MDVLTFLALDFGLRAVTVLTPPGSTGLHSALICLWSLICPAYGVRRALIAVGFTEDGDSELEESIKKAWRRLTARIQRKSEIDMALRSGALCMLVPSSASKRLSLNPPNDHKEPGPEGLPLETINPLMTSVHGQYPPDIKPLSHQDQSLDEEGGKGFEYSLVKVPPSLKVFPIIKEHDPGPLIKRIWRWVSNKPEEPVKHLHKKAVPLRLSSNERIVKALCTIFQLLYGSYELYKMGGDHLKKYGYAAYEFTIIPYLSMSLMNLLVSCVRPTYPTMYIVYYRGTEEHIPTDGRNPSDNNQRTTTDEDQGKPALNQLEVVPVDEKEGADGNQNLDYLKDWWNPSNSEFEENVSGAIGYAYGDLSGKDGSGPGKRHHIFSLSTWTRRFKANVSSPCNSLFIAQ
ncbi:uncharacterized protein H6S33_006987 [Morchella sextelata]|uniref:uncharacterized protein n=1 Tax=Morchella sextelata TaxID=1174677 RepID=UPI001D04093F|nr:uncharacterized protein H6S33_006987 [Morchella sextelata]KAH0603956.1 hypothetical protein H6S33_006987 [Morchella sextelata]